MQSSHKIHHIGECVNIHYIRLHIPRITTEYIQRDQDVATRIKDFKKQGFEKSKDWVISLKRSRTSRDQLQHLFF